MNNILLANIADNRTLFNSKIIMKLMPLFVQSWYVKENLILNLKSC